MNVRRITGTLACLAVLGCGDKVTVNEVERGGESESCRSRNDCEQGLLCIDNVCTRSTAGPADPSANDGGTVKTRSELGESCQTRADCLAPLACIENTCLEGFAPDAAVESTLSRGKRGESCEATNDCESGLACIGSRCLESDFDLEHIPKQCYRVQCATGEDCCKDFKPGGGYTQEQCDTMRSNCEGAGVYPPPSIIPPAVTTNDCLYWTSYCRCTFDCMNEQCLVVPGQFCLVGGQCTTGPGMCVNNRCVACTSDTDCTSTLLPYCASNTCVQCKTDGDCTTAGSRCVSGTCQAGCTANEHCGLLEECVSGDCVEVGCQSDRQCYFLTGDDRSRCVETKCQAPCESDAECVDDFHICADNVCAFAGCDNDDECRAVLGLQNQSATSLDRAVCREPPPVLPPGI
jgi:hypothetical protein